MCALTGANTESISLKSTCLARSRRVVRQAYIFNHASYVLVIPLNRKELARGLAIFADKDIPLITMPPVGQNVTVSHVAALHVPCKGAISSEECINGLEGTIRRLGIDW